MFRAKTELHELWYKRHETTSSMFCEVEFELVGFRGVAAVVIRAMRLAHQSAE